MKRRHLPIRILVAWRGLYCQGSFLQLLAPPLLPSVCSGHFRACRTLPSGPEDRAGECHGALHAGACPLGTGQSGRGKRPSFRSVANRSGRRRSALQVGGSVVQRGKARRGRGPCPPRHRASARPRSSAADVSPDTGNQRESTASGSRGSDRGGHKGLQSDSLRGSHGPRDSLRHLLRSRSICRCRAGRRTGTPNRSPHRKQTACQSDSAAHGLLHRRFSATQAAAIT